MANIKNLLLTHLFILILIGCSSEVVQPVTSILSDEVAQPVASMLSLGEEIISAENASQVKLLGSLSSGAMQDIFFSPTDLTLAVLSTTGVFIYADAEGQQLWSELDDSIKSIAFSPDGKLIAIGSSDTIQLKNSLDGQLIQTLKEPDALIRGITFSPDGAQLAAISEMSVHIWQLDGEKMKQTLTLCTDEPAVDQHGKAFICTDNYEIISSIAFSPDGKMLTSISNHGNTTRLWQLETAKVTKILSGTTQSNIFSPDNTRMAYSSTDSGISLLPLISKQKIHKLEGVGPTFSPDSSLIVSVSSDTIYLWRADNGQLVHSLDGLPGISYISFSPDSSLIAFSSYDTINLWRADNGQLVHSFDVHGYIPREGFFSPDSSLIAVRFYTDDDLDDKIVLWQIDSGQIVQTIEEVRGYYSDISFSLDNRFITNTNHPSDDKSELWRISDGKPAQLTSDFHDAVEHIAISPDRTLFAASLDEIVKLWRLDNGQLVQTIYNTSRDINSITFSPDGSLIAISDDSENVKLWNVSDGQLASTLVHSAEKKIYSIANVAFSSDGKLLASIIHGSEGIISLWEIDEKKLIWQVKENLLWDDIGHAYYSITFSPNNRLLAIGASTQQVRLWQVENGELKQILKWGGAKNIAFSPNGRLLAAGGGHFVGSSPTNLWQVATGELILTISEQEGPIAFSPDGTLIVLAPYYGEGGFTLSRVDNGERLNSIQQLDRQIPIDTIFFGNAGKLIITISKDRVVEFWGIDDE